MKTYMCKDGKRRVFSKTELSFTVDQLATHLLSNYLYDEDPVAEIKKLKTKKAILNAVWDDVLSYGIEVPAYRINDEFHNSAAKVELAVAHLKTIFTDTD